MYVLVPFVVPYIPNIWIFLTLGFEFGQRFRPIPQQPQPFACALEKRKLSPLSVVCTQVHNQFCTSYQVQVGVRAPEVLPLRDIEHIFQTNKSLSPSAMSAEMV